MKRLLLTLILVLLVTSCVPMKSMDTQLNLGKGEAWNFDTEFIMSPEAQMFSGTITESLDEMISSLDEQGIQASWNVGDLDEQGNLTYSISAKGNGFDLLNNSVLEDYAIYVEEVNGDRQIHFDFDFGSEMLGMVEENVFTLQGGKIISTNGTKINSRTVQWINPRGSMEAILTESSNSLWIMFIFLVGLVGGGGYLYWTSRRHSKLSSLPMSTQKPAQVTNPSAGQYCANCGSPMPPMAVFCPNCGAERIKR